MIGRLTAACLLALLVAAPGLAGDARHIGFTTPRWPLNAACEPDSSLGLIQDWSHAEIWAYTTADTARRLVDTVALDLEGGKPAAWLWNLPYGRETWYVSIVAKREGATGPTGSGQCFIWTDRPFHFDTRRPAQCRIRLKPTIPEGGPDE